MIWMTEQKHAQSFFLLFLLTFASSCSTLQPDLARIYQSSQGSLQRHPVVVIHGMMGARLRHRATKEEVWPKGVLELLFGDYSDLALKFDKQNEKALPDDFEPYSFFDSVAGHDFYGEILKTLMGPGGYRSDSTKSGLPQNCYHFFYDWRQDITITARQLDQFIDQIRHEHRDPDLKVDLVAHSMGGLITRYFIRFGSRDVLDDPLPNVTFAGAPKVRKIVLVATPNFGSVIAVQKFMMGYPLAVGNYIQPEIIATMPAAYQLLPHPDGDWMIDIHGNPIKRNLYDPRTWQDYQWSVYDPAVRERISKKFNSQDEAAQYLARFEKYFAYQLERARHLHKALFQIVQDPPIRYIVFGGDCYLTPARCLVEDIEGRTMVRVDPDSVVNRIKGVDYHRLMLDPGDGSVTKPSLLARNVLDPSVLDWKEGFFPLLYVVLICEKHEGLPGNLTFQDNLLNTLLTQETTMDRIMRDNK